MTDPVAGAARAAAAILAPDLDLGLPAEAEDVEIGDERAQFADERAGIEVAGRFAAREKDAQRQDEGRLNSDGSSGRLSCMSSTRRLTVIGPTCRSAKNGIWTPSTAR